MKTQEYNVPAGTNVRTAVENAIIMARATNNHVIVNLNNARFSVTCDTKVQNAIDAYLAVKRKMFETEQQLKQNIKCD